jgi:hypothetical protein
MNPNITSILISKIKNQQSIGFIKFGDGEYFCMNNTYPNGSNIDKDNFTEKKSIALKQAFEYLIHNFSSSVFLGKWHDDWDWNQFLDKNHPISWADYHTLLLDGEDMKNKLLLYKTIRNSDLNKIYIGNHNLQNVHSILNINHYVVVSEQNWFDNDYDMVLSDVLKIMNSTAPNIVMTSAGMSSKILLVDVLKYHPNTIVLDFGSAFDYICTGRQSRTWEPPREYLLELLHHFVLS